jgi:hypothetical protein
MGHYQTGRYLPNLRGAVGGVGAIDGSGNIASPIGRFYALQDVVYLQGNSGSYIKVAKTAGDDARLYIRRSGADKSVPAIYTGVTAPAAAPAQVGDIYVDTVAAKIYAAAAVAAASDWIALN